jgi:two-component system, NtrC family, response regulator AtoC
MAGRPVALILGDESGIGPCVESLGFNPIVADPPGDALTMHRRLSPALVLVNVTGDLAPRLLRGLSRSGTPLVLMRDELEAMPRQPDAKQPVYVLSRPVRPRDLEEVVRHACPPSEPSFSDLGPGARYVSEYAPILARSAKMREIKEIVERIAAVNATVLLRGESGTGKDLVARAIHAASPRAEGPLVKINCAALPSELLESELFGHERGAFTGAHQRNIGKFEFAHKGTIYLDEIGELPLALQAKLLHVVQDFQFSRVGGHEPIGVDTRILASTNRNLELAMSRGEFREDLYYRLNVVEIRLPPLRERPEEIPALASLFLDRFNLEYRQRRHFLPETVALLADYPWPGNVRELENFVRRFVVLGDAERSHAELGASIRAASLTAPAVAHSVAAPTSDVVQSLRQIARRAARDAERKALQEVLDRVRWNRVEAARVLQVSYKTILNKIAECGLGPKAPPRST